MDDTGAGMVTAALLQSLMRVLQEAEVLTPEQVGRVLDGAETVLAEQIPGSRDEAATLDLARSLMVESRRHWD
jgi:hypothetical protein